MLCYNISVPKIKVTKKNPYGLSTKQGLVIEDMLNDVKEGRGLKPVKSTAKIYPVKNNNVAQTMAIKNIGRDNFRKALTDGLLKRQIIGKDSIIEKRLSQGLNAKTGKRKDDYQIRLSYAQEINKIVGVYSPTKTENKTLNLNVDITKEELDNRINTLQEQLK